MNKKYCETMASLKDDKKKLMLKSNRYDLGKHITFAKVLKQMIFYVFLHFSNFLRQFLQIISECRLSSVEISNPRDACMLR